ncbi:hypothetical protein [Streptomyces sp. CB01881]|uniref:hypothetical protein n=1 Tax=Streptomyces sp. CB01881 TaxID=2078691 RepID=UPI00129CCBB0|nr:hypothetical protein [Streptomyces sp. CB01881]
MPVGRGFQVGQWLPADLGLVAGRAEHPQRIFGDLVGRFGVVAFWVVVQESAEAGRRARDEGFRLTRPPYR